MQTVTRCKGGKVRTGERSTLRARTWAALGCAVALLPVALVSGCGSLPSGATSTAESTAAPRAPFSLDQGGLVVTPVTARSPAVPAERAIDVLALQVRYVTSVDEPVLATVTWNAPEVGSGPSRLGVEPGSLVWVLTYRTRHDSPSCPVGVVEPSASVDGSDTWAVIVDATSGEAAIYTGARPVCSSWSHPSIAGATRYVSLPWTVDPSQGSLNDSYRVELPGCASMGGSWTVDGEMTLIAQEPLDGACSGPARAVHTDGTAAAEYATHAPTGLLCAGHGPDVRLPRPRDCVAASTF